MPHIPEANLRRIARLVLEHAGSEAGEADIVADHLVGANLAGHDSHGVGLIPTYVRNLEQGYLVANRRLKPVSDAGAILMFDGERGYGQVLAKAAMERSFERVRETGVVLMTLRNAHHIGRVGTYGEQSLAEGFVSLHFVSVTGHRPVVAPFGGSEARFVTNPICIAMPGSDATDDLLLDMATSRIALGKARVAMVKGEPVPEGAVLDADGEPTTDPSVLFREPPGALLPFGEHKGSGLALMCELLAGGLSGGGTIQPERPRGPGIYNHMFTIVVDPARLVDLSWLAHEVDAIVAYVKSSRRDADTERVQVAGDPERATGRERRRSGIPLAEGAWNGIVAAGEGVGVAPSELEAIRAA